jgi:asparagine synthase (glutamine-hydrolysing)
MPNYILKQALRDILPVGILERKSRGMRVPVDDWFRGELAGFAHDALTGPSAASRGIFDMTAVQAMLDAHLTGQADLGDALWTLLTFELWLQRSF